LAIDLELPDRLKVYYQTASDGVSHYPGVILDDLDFRKIYSIALGYDGNTIDLFFQGELVFSIDLSGDSVKMPFYYFGVGPYERIFVRFDELAVYNRRLTDSEIKLVSEKRKRLSNLELLVRFKELSGAPIEEIKNRTFPTITRYGYISPLR